MNAAAVRRRALALRPLGLALTGQVPALSPDRWDAVAELAVEHHLGPALYAAAVRPGPPPGLTDLAASRLADVYRRNLGRNVRMRHQLGEVLAHLQSRGMDPIALKGAAYLLDGTFGDPGVRVMADLDLLVGPDAVDDGVAALTEIGYEARPRPDFSAPHEVLMAAPNHFPPVEVHAEVGARQVRAVLATPEVIARARPRSAGAVRWRELDPTDAVTHNVLHAQLQDAGHWAYALPMRQLHTFVRVIDARRGEIDWTWITSRFETHGLGRVLAGYLDLAVAVFGPQSGTPRIRPTPVRRALCLASSAMGGWPSDLALNLREALEPAYLRDRYGSRLPVAALRARHLFEVWREAGRDSMESATAARR